MSESAQDIEIRIKQLDEKWELEELSELEYKEQKWKALQQLCDRGKVLSPEFFFPEMQETTDANGKEFCYVGTGPFVFGPEDQFCELKAPIYISKFPVTVAEFVTFVEESGYSYPEEDLEQLHLVSPEPTCPACHISWLDAKEYCRWLRKRNCEYYSLPHEIEWERAARGIDGRFYPWGNSDPTPEQACFRDPIDYKGTAPVEAFIENCSPTGCVGMVGNTWEWCLDTIKDPRDPHILRGGSWCNPVDYCNCISRTFSFPPEKRVDYGGFRIVYLPQEMLIEYRRQYASGMTTSSNLTVVTHAKRKTRMLEERPEWQPSATANSPSETGAVRAKKAAKSPEQPSAAASKPSGTADADDFSLNELMAQAISEAADIYRTSLENPQELPPLKTRPRMEPIAPVVVPMQKEKEAKDEPKAEKKALKKSEVAAEPEEKASPLRKLGEQEKEKKKKKGRTRSDLDQAVQKYLRIAVIVWCSIFAALIALIVQKMLTFG